MEQDLESNEAVGQEFALWQQIRMQTWVKISGSSPQCSYYEYGSYSLSIECRFLDGAQRVKRALLKFDDFLEDESDAPVEKYENKFPAGSLHFIDCRQFRLRRDNIAFTNPETTPIAAEDEVHVRKVFEQFESILTGTISKLAVYNTIQGTEMAFIGLEEHPEVSVVVLPDDYEDFREILLAGGIMEFIGTLTVKTENNNIVTHDLIPIEIRTISATATGME